MISSALRNRSGLCWIAKPFYAATQAAVAWRNRKEVVESPWALGAGRWSAKKSTSLSRRRD